MRRCLVSGASGGGGTKEHIVEWVATAELECLARDRTWMDKAVRIIERAVEGNNRKARNNPRELAA